MNIEDFSANIARPDPAIAGGNVAAHVGSFAAALGEMMAGLSEGRPEFAGEGSLIREIHIKLTEARSELHGLAAEDSRAFGLVLTAKRMPRHTKEEEEARTEALECAMKDATRTPMKNVRAAFRVLELLRRLVEIGNPNARTDAAIGAQLAYASLKSAQLSVLANYPGIRDRAFAECCLKEADDLVRSAQELIRQIDLLMKIGDGPR